MTDKLEMLNKEARDAVNFVIIDWRERQLAALQAVTFPQLKDDDHLKTIAWLNFGWDAAKNLYPDAGGVKAVAAAVEKCAIPIWVLSQAQTAFSTIRDRAIAEQQRGINMRYVGLREMFFRHVQRTARDFAASHFGRGIVQQLVAHCSRPDVESKLKVGDAADFQRHMRRLIDYSNVIETDVRAIRERTENGFGKLCLKIMKIYFGTHHDWGHNQLFIEGTEWSIRANFAGHGVMSRHDTLVRSKKAQDEILANAWQYEVTNVIDEPWFIAQSPQKFDRTYLRKINNSATPFSLPANHRLGAIDFNAAERIIQSRYNS